MSISITPEIRSYALSIASVGNRMKVTSDKFGVATKRKIATVEDIKALKREYLNLLEEFKSQEQTLMQLTTPLILKEEHEELLVSFNKYVTATELGIDSLNVESIITNESILKKAQDLQREASSEIVYISKKIATKLGI